MERMNIMLAILDEMLDSRKKKHLVGGVLLSTSLLFGGLAVTVLTLKMEEEYNELQIK